jgi:hypothetical protein
MGSGSGIVAMCVVGVTEFAATLRVLCRCHDLVHASFSSHCNKAKSGWCLSSCCCVLHFRRTTYSPHAGHVIYCVCGERHWLSEPSSLTSPFRQKFTCSLGQQIVVYAMRLCNCEGHSPHRTTRTYCRPFEKPKHILCS